MNFVVPKPEDYGRYRSFLECNEMTCENSFLNAVMWGKKYNYNYAVINDGKSLVIRIDEEHEAVYFLPLGENFSEAMDKILEYCGNSALFCASEGERLERLKEKYGEKIELIPIDTNYEYIYNSEDLALLSGKKYHQKRNHISAFSRKYNWHFEDLSDENINDVLKITKQWAKEHDSDNDVLSTELEAIARVMKEHKQLSIIGGVLYVDDIPVAFTFGQRLNDEVFDVTTEKALASYPGAYAVINNQFVKNRLYPKYKFINREDDLGIEGLRKSKQSYHPAVILKKYLIKFDEKSL